MSEFKIGDRVVRVRGSHRGMVVGDTAVVLDVNERGRVRLEGYGEGNGAWHDNNNLKLVEKTMDNLQVGDIVTRNYYGDEETFTVEGVIGRVYVGIDADGDASIYSAQGLIRNDYTLEGETKEMTVAEIEEKLGHPVKVVKEDE